MLLAASETAQLSFQYVLLSLSISYILSGSLPISLAVCHSRFNKMVFVIYLIWISTTYFVHWTYESVFDGNADDDVDNDCGVLINICCGAHKQVIFKFSPTESLSVTKIELKIVFPGNVLSNTSASYGT